MKDVRLKMCSDINNLTSNILHHVVLAYTRLSSAVGSTGPLHFFWRPYRGGNTCSHSEHSS